MKTAKIVILSATAMVGMWACGKDNDNNPSTKEMITGKWTVNALAYDANNNHVRDGAETTVRPDSVIFTETFNADGTGVAIQKIGSDAADTNQFTWELAGDSEMKINVDNQVRSIKILSLTSTAFNVLDYSDSSNFTWYDLKK